MFSGVFFWAAGTRGVLRSVAGDGGEMCAEIRRALVAAAETMFTRSTSGRLKSERHDGRR